MLLCFATWFIKKYQCCCSWVWWISNQIYIYMYVIFVHFLDFLMRNLQTKKLHVCWLIKSNSRNKTWPATTTSASFEKHLSLVLNDSFSPPEWQIQTACIICSTNNNQRIFHLLPQKVSENQKPLEFLHIWSYILCALTHRSLDSFSSRWNTNDETQSFERS